MNRSKIHSVGHHSIAVVEPLEARRMFTADLAAAFPAHIVGQLEVGHHASVNVKLRNVGDERARGSASVAVYLSADDVLDASDPLLVLTAPKSINLKPQATRSISARLTSPPNTVLGGYFLFAVARPGATIPDSNAANNVAMSGNRLNIVNPPPPSGHHHDNGGDGSGSDDYGSTIDDSDDGGIFYTWGEDTGTGDSSTTQSSSGDDGSSTSTDSGADDSFDGGDGGDF